MGEIADMMLDGTMCAMCGVFLHDGQSGQGFPGYCSRQCAMDAGVIPEKKFDSPFFVIRKEKDLEPLREFVSQNFYNTYEETTDKVNQPLFRLSSENEGQKHPKRVATVCVKRENLLDTTRQAIQERLS